MIHIRPHQLLEISDNLSEEINFFMPPPHGGSLTTLESVMLLKLLRLVKPDYIFEFGNYMGHTTRLLLENIPESSIENDRIYTLDLPALININFQGNGKQLAEEAINCQRKYLTSPRKKLVKQILQDSMALDPNIYRGKFQFIFIDANHKLDYVRRDTENSLKMLSNSLSCIVWHDYGNPEFPQLTEYLNESSEIKLYHIEETMLVFHLLGKDVPPRKIPN